MHLIFPKCLLLITSSFQTTSWGTVTTISLMAAFEIVSEVETLDSELVLNVVSFTDWLSWLEWELDFEEDVFFRLCEAPLGPSWASIFGKDFVPSGTLLVPIVPFSSSSRRFCWWKYRRKCWISDTSSFQYCASKLNHFDLHISLFYNFTFKKFSGFTNSCT